MLDFLTAQANMLYGISFSVVICLGIIEALAMFAGLSVLSALDDLIPIDLDYDADVSDGGVTGILGWLCLDRLPLLIWLVLALTSFAIAGYSVNFIYTFFTSLWLPQLYSVPLAFVGMLLSCRHLGSWLGKVLPKNESSAVYVDELAGRLGTVTVGCASKGNPAEALVRDVHQQKHYVMVEPEFDGEKFDTGAEVVLLARLGRVWSAAKFEHE